MEASAAHKDLAAAATVGLAAAPEDLEAVADWEAVDLEAAVAVL